MKEHVIKCEVRANGTLTTSDINPLGLVQAPPSTDSHLQCWKKVFGHLVHL